MKRLVWLAPAVFAAAVFAIRIARPSVAAAEKPVPFNPITFNRQIAPILYKNCTTCHHPGGAGPFSLLNYADARRWGPQMVTVTQSRFMPPWLPEPGYGDFAHSRRLPDEDIALIRGWVKSGMLEGNRADAPVAPVIRKPGSWGNPILS